MKSWNIVFIFTCFFTSAFSAYSPEIRLTSAIASSVASSTCVEETFTITFPYGITGQDMNCSMNHPINLLFDGDENTWWQSVTEDENVTINFQFDDPFLLSGAQLAFRSPLPQLLLVQARLNRSLVATLAYADDCQLVANGTCYPLESIVDYEVVNCSEISLCPRLVNLSHSLLNITADSITYMFININTELLSTPESQYYAVAEVTIYGYLPANNYFSSLHSIIVEAESGLITGSNDPLPVLTAIPQFSGIGYTTNNRILPFSWFIEIPRLSTYRMILRYGNINNFIEAPLFTVTSLVMSMVRNGNEHANRFFIDGCDMVWCYSQAVGRADTTTVVSYELEAGLWEIRALMNLSNILLDAFIAIPEEFYNPVSLGLAGAERFNDECGLSTNTLGRGTTSEYFCFQSAFILSYNFNPMLYECACDAIGSVEQLCDPIGGQCPCIQPVNGSTYPYGLNCDVCPSLSYGPTNTGCEECNCSNNSQQCDKRTGQCPCPPLVTGSQCSACELNTFGDPALGCTPCSCDEPGTIACNTTSGECICESYYAGVTCGQCMIDAFNDTVAGCQPCQCNLTGSINQSCSSTGQCNCKPLVTGPKCSSCEAGAFYFTDNGCIECWCNGLTGIECDTFTGSYETVIVRFDDIEEWSLVVLNGDEFLVTTTGIYLEEFGDTEETVLSANISDINSSMPIYWNVSSNYINMNWLFTYGADLIVETIQGNGIVNVGSANGVEGETGSLYSLYGVYLMDESTVLVHSIDPTMDINIISIALVEDSWLDASTQRPVTRPAFMSVLGGLSTILLPAVPADTSITITRLTSFQYGNASTLGNNKIPIESCSCPEGHTGSSCQECTDDYFMSSSGACILCQCNGHSTDCDPVTGQCQDCQNNTKGFNCEECLPCYISITSGSSFMCEACNCSSTGCRNCSINIFGEEQCACLTGYQGDQCSLCDEGYFQSPLSGECILSCGECVDKLVMMHNESMQDVTTLQNKFRAFNDDLYSIYQQLQYIASQAISLMDRINVSLDVHQQLEDDLNMVDDCSMDVNNITLQVNALRQQAVQLYSQIDSIPNLTNNTAEAMSLYRTTSTFNMTVFVALSQLESLSMQANTILMNLTDTAAANMNSYVNEINESLQVLQNTKKAQASANSIERVVSAHQGKLINVTAQLKALSMNISSLNTQVEQLNVGVADLQRLTFDIQELRLTTMSLFFNVSNNYNRAINVSQLAIQLFTTAIYLEQNITIQLQTISEGLADLDGGSGSDNQGGKVFQELSRLESAVQNSFAFLLAINNSQAMADASTHTNQLDINATIISRILVPALSMQPAEIVRNFSGLLASIEMAAKKSMQANTTITEIQQEVIQLMSEGLADRATEVYSLAQNLTSTLNITHYGLGQIQATVNRANKKASILRNEIENSVELALNQVSQLQSASNTVQYQVNTALDSATSNLQCVSEGLYLQQCDVDEELYDRLTAVENSMRNSSSLLNEANISLSKTLAIIDNQTKIIPDIQNQSIANSKQIEQLNISVQTLRERMATARMALSSIAVALRLSGNQTYSYSLPTAPDEGGAEHTQLSLIFRTIGPDGTLLYNSNSMDQCVSLGVANRQVVFSFALDGMSIFVNNPLSVQDNVWYQVFATRDEDVGRLSVTELQGTTVTAFATGIGSSNASAIPLMDKIYIGGTSSMMTANCVSSEQFTGCVDTVIINNRTLPLLLPNEGLDSVTPCGPRPPIEPTRLFDSSAWLLGAGSYVILRGEQQSTDIFRVMMGFRTSNLHGIFYLSGTSRIHLMDGQVWYRISGIFSECEVNTVQQYDDNIWHYLTALYSGGECSITVDDEMVIQSTELTFSTDVSDVYIGGVPNVPERVPFVSFAGCLRDVIIGTDARNLSDNMGSERVKFNGCPVNVTSGVRFNGEGYALLEIATELINVNLTNIMFSFKTTQVTGLLLQLGSENKLILSLYHSHVRLEYYYNTESVVVESPSPGYNDNFWHTVSVTLVNNMITLMVDSVIATSQDLPTITLSDRSITIGGAYPNNFPSNIAISFRGCFRDLVINNQSHDFYNPISLVGVSLFGCYLPADLPFVPTSTVAAMATIPTIPSMSIQTSALIPLPTTAGMITTQQIISPTATFSPQTLDVPTTSDSLSITMTPTVVLATPSSVVSSTLIIITEISASVVSVTLTSVILEIPTSVASEISTSIIPVTSIPVSETFTTLISVVSETSISVVSTSVVSETPASIISETPTSVISVTSTSIISEAPISVVSTSVVSETSISVVSTSVVSETPSSIISEVPTSVISVTSTSIISEAPISVVSTSVISETPSSIISEAPTSIISETPTSLISVTSTSIISEAPTSVVTETPTSIISETPTSIILEIPTSVISETSTSIILETPTSVISVTSTSIISEAPISVISTSVVSETPTFIISEAPTSVISVTSTSIISEAPISVVSTSVVSETPTFIISEAPTSVISVTSTSIISEAPTSVVSVTSTSIISEAPTSVISVTSTSIISETPTSLISVTSTSIISEAPTSVVSTSVVTETPTSIISETPTSLISVTSTSINSEAPTSVVSTSVVTETPTSTISEAPTSLISVTSTSIISETPTSVISVTSTSIISEAPTSVILVTSTSIISEAPTSVVSVTSTSIISEAPTSVVSTSVVSETPTSVISVTSTSTISETPTSLISVTSNSIISEAPTSVVSTSVVTETPTSTISEVPTSLISVTSTSIISETPTSVISVTSTSIISEAPISVVSTSVVSETPTFIISEAPTSVISVTSTSIISEAPTSVVSVTSTSIISEAPTSVVSTSVVTETPTSTISEAPTSLISVTSTSIISEAPTSVVSVTSTSIISEAPTSVVSTSVVTETPTSTISEAPTSLISVTSTSIISEAPTSVVSVTSTSIISEAPTSVVSTSVVTETPTSTISEAPTSLISVTSTSIISETPTSVISVTLTSIISEAPTSVILVTSTSTISETPTSLISVTSTSIISEAPTSVVSTSVVTETPISIISETPTSIILEIPTSVISETSTSIILEVPTSVVSTSVISRSVVLTSEAPTSVISVTTTSIISEAPTSVVLTSVVSETPTSIISETPTSMISVTSTSIISEAPTSVVSTSVVTETPTSIILETPTSVISVTSTSIISEVTTSVISRSVILTSEAPTSVISVTTTSIISEAPTSVVLTSVVSETPTSIFSETPTSMISATSTSIISEAPTSLVLTSVVSETPKSIISETPTSVISVTSTSIFSEASTSVVSTSVVSQTPTSLISVTSTPETSTPETPTSVILTSIVSETPTFPVSETSTSIVSGTLTFTVSTTSMVSETPTSLVTATETSLTAVLNSTFTMTASQSSITPLSSQSAEISITPTSTVTLLISTLPTLDTTAFTSASVVSVITTTATKVISETTIPIESSELSISTTDITLSSSLSPVSSAVATDITSIMLTSLIESSATSTTVSSVASSTIALETTIMTTDITTPSSEVSTLAATTTHITTTTGISLSSETPIITMDVSTSVITTSSSLAITTGTTTTSTVTSLSSLTTSQTPAISTSTTEILPSTSVLTTSTTTILPTSTPLPQLLGLNGLSSFISLAPRLDILSSYNIQLVFQTRSSDGILLYTGNMENGDYFALYLRNGLVTYSFDLGGGTVTVTSNRQYSNGLLHNVTINRNGHVSLVTIDDGAEVIRAVGSNSFTQLNLGMDNFYVGGVTPPVALIDIFGQGEQSFPSVEACIKSLYINNEPVDLNVNTNNSGIVECNDVLLDDVATFTGNNSYAKLVESFSPITDFRLTMSFRNTIRNKVDCKGLLVYIGSSNYVDHLMLNLDSGRLLLTFNNGEGTIAVEYGRAEVNFCDGNWYEVEVAKSGANGHLIINGTDSEMSSTGFSVFVSIDSTEPFFVGGIPSTVATEHNVMFTPFSGCIRNLMLHRNGQIVPAFISRSVELVNVNLETCSL